jgi:sugar lactone lactonase YvrE
LFIFIAVTSNIPSEPKWAENGVTVAGGHGEGNALRQLKYPAGFYVDDNQTIYIADWGNSRILQWKYGATSGQIVAGGKGTGSGSHQLYHPTDVILDRETNGLLICDKYNRRVMKWPREDGTKGEVIINKIDCWGLALDSHRFIYVSDYKKHEVRRYRIGETNGIVVAGGNGQGDRFDQFNEPTYLFVDQDQTVYVSDHENHRVMKWVKGAKEGVLVAGGQSRNSDLTNLFYPNGVFVDSLGAVYVADLGHRVMRWRENETRGTEIVGGNGRGEKENQLYHPIGLSFDQYGNLYVADERNYRIQKFSIKTNSSYNRK